MFFVVWSNNSFNFLLGWIKFIVIVVVIVNFIVTCMACGSPYLGRATARAVLPFPTSVCSILCRHWYGCQCLGFLMCAQLFMHIIIHACTWQGLCKHRKRVHFKGEISLMLVIPLVNAQSLAIPRIYLISSSSSGLLRRQVAMVKAAFSVYPFSTISTDYLEHSIQI